jgi:putative DNA primase/helicase
MDNTNLKNLISKASRNNWTNILQASTGLSAKAFKNIHQPCPLCRKGTDRYRFDNNKGFGTYFCSKCGPGDGYKFLAKFYKYNQQQVLEHLDELLGISNGNPKVDVKAFNSKPDNIKDIPPRVIIPAPVHAPKANFYHFKFGKPSKVWEFTSEAGDICFYTVRFDHPGGGKDVLPMSYCQYYDKREGVLKYGWRWRGVTKDSGFKRPLYGLPTIKLKDWVIVVEGEKAADAARKLFPDYGVVTWSGGTKSLQMTDWSPLLRKNIIIWPDNDEPGYSSCIELYLMFLEYNINRRVLMVEVVDIKPSGWDLADTQISESTKDALQTYIKANAFSVLSCAIPKK